MFVDGETVPGSPEFELPLRFAGYGQVDVGTDEGSDCLSRGVSGASVPTPSDEPVRYTETRALPTRKLR